MEAFGTRVCIELNSAGQPSNTFCASKAIVYGLSPKKPNEKQAIMFNGTHFNVLNISVAIHRQNVCLLGAEHLPPALKSFKLAEPVSSQGIHNPPAPGGGAH